MSVVGLCGRCAGGAASATPSVRTLEKRYGQRRMRLETHEFREVDDHIDEGAADQALGRRS
jgi:hypothetical protein